MGRVSRAYTSAEQWVDRVVHWFGITGAIIGIIVLMIAAALVTEREPLLWGSLIVYSVGLLGMFVCSALCNHDLSDSSRWAGIFRRLDHAAILLMIAATYTPLALHVLGGVTGWVLFAVVWSVALVGMALRLFHRQPLEARSSLALYLILGWIGVFVLYPLVASASPVVLGLILLGGLLYCAGVPFHLWRHLTFHKAIWHGFVLAAAASHYVAVLLGVALTGGAASSS
ncbi:hemolysin III family protein [Aquisalimonas sp.]|uniref:PAQR family membrane homeostasis protein TrhA n=1 Tax=Aquisalimonas sp. TaxID=1872621 RepID=UPI0025C3D0F4|nr:hemolysin III family protein [Aquisalimonas sp.]